MTVPPTKEGQTAPACPCPTRGKIFSNSHSGKSASSWTGRKHKVAAKSDWETTQEKTENRLSWNKMCWGPVGSAWLTGLVCKGSRMQEEEAEHKQGHMTSLQEAH